MSVAVSLPSWEIATPIATASCIPSTMKSSEARDFLGSLRFDQAPVMRDQRVTGWVRTAHLVGRGFAAGRITPLDECTILARETPVSDTIKAVAAQHLVFLAGPDGISEFVVPSDLDRHAVRCYLYVLVSELEMRMADLADMALSADQMEAALGSETRRYREAQKRGMETRVVDYLNFSAYAKLALDVPAIVAAFPGTADSMAAALGRLTKLRNHVAHPTKPMAAEFEPSELAGLMQLAETFLDALRPPR